MCCLAIVWILSVPKLLLVTQVKTLRRLSHSANFAEQKFPPLRARQLCCSLIHRPSKRIAFLRGLPKSTSLCLTKLCSPNRFRSILPSAKNIWPHALSINKEAESANCLETAVKFHFLRKTCLNQSTTPCVCSQAWSILRRIFPYWTLASPMLTFNTFIPIKLPTSCLCISILSTLPTYVQISLANSLPTFRCWWEIPLRGLFSPLR